MGIQDELGGLSDRLRDLGARLRDEADRARARFDAQNGESHALATFMRPNLGPTPVSLRRYLEPLVAIAAGLVLAGLLAFGLYGFAMFFLSASLIYLILTHVFGLEFDLNLPF